MKWKRHRISAARHLGQGAEERAKEAIHHLGVLLCEELAHEGVGLIVGTREQAHEGAPAVLGVGGEFQRGAEEGLDDAAGLERGSRGLGLQAVEFVEAARVEAARRRRKTSCTSASLPPKW
jgi:hypothetical protein